MPTIKLKKATADYIAEKERERVKEKEKNGTYNKREKSQPKAEKKMMKGLDGEVLLEKRKRIVPPSEQAAIDWINDHLESKPGFNVQVVRLYECYADACQTTATPSLVVDTPNFHKILLDRVGKEFAFKSSSPLKHVIAEKDIQAEKEKRKNSNVKKFSVVATLKEVLKELGNSRRGLMFSKIMKAMYAKNPKIKRGQMRYVLEAGMYRGEISIVKGVGYAGSYRLTGEPSESETEELEKAQKKKEESNGNTESNSKPKKKKKKTEATGDEEDDQKSEEKEDGEEREEGTEENKKKKKKMKKKIVYRPATIHSIKHCDPKRLEDVFPLAITFGCEPKETTVVKIKNYISKYYPSIDVEKKLQPALDKGVEAGVFEKISSIKYRLHADEFDPYKKESVQECITSAIIASTEPKVSSIRSIKKYIQEYHHEFNLDYKPALLTNALERASNKHILKHISGIGASGSVQLLLPFIPSPGILAGDEDEVEVSSEYIAKPSRSRSSPMAKVEEFHTVRSPPRDRSKVVKPKTSPNHDKKKEINGGVVKKKTKGKMGKAKTAAVKKDARQDDVKSDMKDDAKKEEIVEVSKIQQKKLKGNNRSSKVNNSKTDIDPPVQEENPPVKAAKRTRLTPKAKPSTMRERSSRGRSSVSYREDESEVDENSEDEDKEPAAKKSRRKK